METKEIGNRIKSRRKELDLTLDEVAAAVGVAASTIQRYELGTFAKMKLPVIEAIASALDVNPMWIIGKTDDPSVRSESTMQASSMADIKAAFFEGLSDDLTPEERDEYWNDARAYLQFKLSQRKKKE